MQCSPLSPKARLCAWGVHGLAMGRPEDCYGPGMRFLRASLLTAKAGYRGAGGLVYFYLLDTQSARFLSLG